MSERGQTAVRVGVLDGDVLAQYAFENLFQQSPEIELVAKWRSVASVSDVLLDDMDVLLAAAETMMVSGVDLPDYLSRLAKKVTVLVVSARVESELVVTCLKAGASGFVWKSVDAMCIIQAIKSVLAGERPIMPPIEGDLLFYVLNHSVPHHDHGSGLTNREHEVLCLIANGMSNKEIATVLDLSVRTVKAHVSNVLRKLGVADRTQAAVLAVKTGADHPDNKDLLHSKMSLTSLHPLTQPASGA